MPRVLLIEDDQAVRDGLSMALTGRGLAVDAVETGEQGLALPAARPPDVVVLDLIMLTVISPRSPTRDSPAPEL